MRPHDSVFCAGSEFRDSDSKSAASFPGSDVAYEPVCVEKDTSAVSVGRRLVRVEWPAFITVALLYGIGLVSAWFLSLVVRVHGDQFPFGALTPLQLTAFSLSFFAIALQVSNTIYAWLRCSRETALAIRAASEVGACLLLIFACDRTTLLLRRPRMFNGDFFCFVAFTFACAALATARRIYSLPRTDVDHWRAVLLPPNPPTAEQPASPALLHRHHVEECLGWVALLYLLYGYFQNVHIYGMVRLCLSGIAFLTAFTTYVRFDAEVSLQESVVLLVRSLWKLNFLAATTCAVLRNQYMLYHLCAVQTFVTVAVYLLMNVGPSPRFNHGVLAAKVGFAAVVGCVLWDTPYSPTVFRFFWSPLQWLVRYDNPIVSVEPLHEWQFRSRLDHWIWLVGVVTAHCAFFLNGVLRRLDGQRSAGAVIKVAIAGVAVCVVGLFAYLTRYASRVGYNQCLPYLSWAPILAFVALRCVFRRARSLYMPLCAFLGAFAMEAYVAHNHIFMATTGTNGGPLYTLRILPGDHPLCDFGIFLMLTLGISCRIAMATQRLQEFLLPDGAHLPLVAENAVALLLVLTGTYFLHCLWCAKNTKASIF